MDKPDLNLLFTLDAVLAEGSVVGAGRRLGLSPSAMSRSLARLRETTGDPLLVRAGRGLVPTPRAIELRESISQLVLNAEAALRPVQQPDLKNLARTFTFRTSQGFVENFGAELLANAGKEAPNVRFRFLEKTTKQSNSLRDGTVDLEIGVVGEAVSPEIRTQSIFRDRFVGVVRKKHSLCRGAITPARFAAGLHINVSRRGNDSGPIDEALELLGLGRNVVTVVGGFSTALALARISDLVVCVPERQTGNLREDMHSFRLPFPTREINVSLLWHPRMDADPAHRWLRSIVVETCRTYPK